MVLGDTAVAVNLLLCFVLTEGGKVYPTSMAAGKRPSLDVNCTTDEQVNDPYPVFSLAIYRRYRSFSTDHV